MLVCLLLYTRHILAFAPVGGCHLCPPAKCPKCREMGPPCPCPLTPRGGAVTQQVPQQCALRSLIVRERLKLALWAQNHHTRRCCGFAQTLSAEVACLPTPRAGGSGSQPRWAQSPSGGAGSRRANLESSVSDSFELAAFSQVKSGEGRHCMWLGAQREGPHRAPRSLRRGWAGPGAVAQVWPLGLSLTLCECWAPHL